MENISPERVKQIVKSARRHITKKNLPIQDADDFAQEALIKIMNGRKTRLKYILIDYLRANYSNPRAKSGKDKYNITTSYSELNEDTMSEPTYKDDLDFNALKNTLDSKERAIVTLRYKWGFTEKEIGDCFGITEGRVSQHLKEIKSSIAKTIELDSSK